MSGSGLAPWSLVSNPAKYAAIVAHYVHCAPDLPHAHFMKCLRDKPLEQLLKVPVPQPDFGYAFGPSIDGVVIDGGDYVPYVPQTASKINAATRLSSTNQDEHAFRMQSWGTPGQLENKGKYKSRLDENLFLDQVTQSTINCQLPVFFVLNLSPYSVSVLCHLKF